MAMSGDVQILRVNIVMPYLETVEVIPPPEISTSQKFPHLVDKINDPKICLSWSFMAQSKIKVMSSQTIKLFLGIKQVHVLASN